MFKGNASIVGHPVRAPWGDRGVHVMSEPELYETVCPNCSKTFDVPEDVEEAHCPYCDALLRFDFDAAPSPEASEPEPSAADQEAKQAEARRRRREERDAEKAEAESRKAERVRLREEHQQEERDAAAGKERDQERAAAAAQKRARRDERRAERAGRRERARLEREAARAARRQRRQEKSIPPTPTVQEPTTPAQAPPAGPTEFQIDCPACDKPFNIPRTADSGACPHCDSALVFESQYADYQAAYPVTCPTCSHAHEVPADRTHGECPNCHAALVYEDLHPEVPAPSPLPVPPPEAGPMEAPRARRRPKPVRDSAPAPDLAPLAAAVAEDVPRAVAPESGGLPHKVDCPSCSKSFLVTPKEREGNCPHCNAPLAFLSEKEHESLRLAEERKKSFLARLQQKRLEEKARDEERLRAAEERRRRRAERVAESPVRILRKLALPRLPRGARKQPSPQAEAPPATPPSAPARPPKAKLQPPIAAAPIEATGGTKQSWFLRRRAPKPTAPGPGPKRAWRLPFGRAKKEAPTAKEPTPAFAPSTPALPKARRQPKPSATRLRGKDALVGESPVLVEAVVETTPRASARTAAEPRWSFFKKALGKAQSRAAPIKSKPKREKAEHAAVTKGAWRRPWRVLRPATRRKQAAAAIVEKATIDLGSGIQSAGPPPTRKDREATPKATRAPSKPTGRREGRKEETPSDGARKGFFDRFRRPKTAPQRNKPAVVEVSGIDFGELEIEGPSPKRKGRR